MKKEEKERRSVGERKKKSVCINSMYEELIAGTKDMGKNKNDSI